MRETLSSAKYVNNLHKEFENSAYTTLDVRSVHALAEEKKRHLWVIESDCKARSVLCRDAGEKVKCGDLAV